MKAIGKALLILVLTIVLGAGFVGCQIYGGYNRAVTLEGNVKASWAQVENQLQRRFDLIHNLVETVKGVAAQEKDVFLGVAEARKAYTQAGNVGDKVKAANSFESALSRLLVIQEKYPELRSNESFMKLQDAIEGTENRLAVERQRYNDAVRGLNTFAKQFFGRFYASMAGVGPAEYFKVEAEAKTAPKVDFSGGKP